MDSRRSSGLMACLAVVVLVLIQGGLQAADRSPALSTVVPAEDLVAQLEYYVEELEECVQDAGEYEDSVGKIEKYANTLAVISLAIGLHDKDNKYRKAAPALVKASQELAAAQDFASAMAGVERVKSALGATGDPSTLRWVKVAHLKALMQRVPLISSRIKRYMRRFERGADDIIGGSAAIAVIAQGSLPNADETEEPDKVEEWFKYCIQMRDAASALNQAAHAKDEAAAKAAMEALDKSCDDCHAVFHKN